MRTFRVILILAFLALLPTSPRAWASDPLLEILGPVPADVDFAVVVRDAEGLRKTQFGVATQQIAERVLVGGDLDQAWSGFASALRMSEQEAFDFCLGRVFALVGRQDEARGEWAWALLTLLPKEQTDRLVDAAPGAPRRRVGGRAVIEIEGGRFDLMLHPRGRMTTVLVGPSRRSALFDEMAPRLAGGGDAASLRSAEATRTFDREAGSHFFGFWRDTLAHGGWVAIRGGVDEGRLTAEFAAVSKGALPEAPLWSLERVDRLTGEDAFFVAMERRLTVGSENLSAIPGPLRDLPWLVFADGAGQGFGPMQGVAVARGEEGGLEVTGLLQARDAERLPEQGDGFARALAGELGERLGVGRIEVDFNGAWPKAPRTITLTGEGGPTFPFLAGRSFDLHWSHETGARGAMGAEEAWLVLSTDDASRGAAAAAMRVPAKGNVGAWVSVLRARPAALLREMKRDAGALPPILDVVLTLERIEFEAAQVTPRLVRGGVEIDMDATALAPVIREAAAP